MNFLMQFQSSNLKKEINFMKILCWERFKIKEKFINANHKDTKTIKSFKSLKNLSFIELPKMGLQELKR